MKKQSQVPALIEVLHAAHPDSLIAFLKKQAGRSLALEIKLRTALIRETQVAEGVNKYGQILGLLIKHNVHGRVRLTKRSMQLLREVCESFTTLQEQLLQEGELREAWECCIPMITQLQMLMDRYHGPDEKLVSLLTLCYGHVELILELSPAPELRQDIHQAIFHTASRSPHAIYDLRHNAVNTLFYSARDPRQRSEVMDLINTCVKDPMVSSLQRKYWGAMLLKAPGATAATLNALSQDERYDIGYLLSAVGERAALKRLVQLFPVLDQLGRPASAQWARWKFDIALEEGMAATIRETGIELLHLDHQIATFQRMRAHLSFDALSDSLSTLPADLLCAIYAGEDQWKRLDSVVRTEHDPVLLLPYIGPLAEHSSDFVTLVKDLVLHYVAHHGGPQCALMLSQLYDALKANQKGNLASEIAILLATHYPDRFDQPKKRSAAVAVNDR